MKLKKGNIGLVSFEIGVHRGYEEVRSAHIQVPIEIYQGLMSNDISPVIFTNRLRIETDLPKELKPGGVIYISDPRIRKKTTVMYSGFSTKVNVIKVFISLLQIAFHSYRLKIGTLHFTSGSASVGMFAGILSLITPGIRIIWTPSSSKIPGNRVYRNLVSNIDCILVHTQYIESIFQSIHRNVKVIRHGISRRLVLEEGNKTRVTYWRDPSLENGADIALKVFEILAEKRKEILFTFMVRPYFDSVKLTSQFPNIIVHNFPYSQNVSLEKVLGETIVCVFPFRELSTNPQLSILETLDAGIPCICSDIESVSEYGINKDLLVKSGQIEKYVHALEKVLDNPKYFTPEPLNKSDWNWLSFIKEYLKLIDNE